MHISSRSTIDASDEPVLDSDLRAYFGHGTGSRRVTVHRSGRISYYGSTEDGDTSRNWLHPCEWRCEIEPYVRCWLRESRKQTASAGTTSETKTDLTTEPIMQDPIQSAFALLARDLYLRPIVSDLEACWIRHGRPDVPAGSTTTDCCPISYPGTSPESVRWCDVEGEESESESALIATLIDDAHDRLGDLLDVRGSYTTWEEGSEAWEDYKTAGRDLVADWLASDAWDRWCAVYGDSTALEVSQCRDYADEGSARG